MCYNFSDLAIIFKNNYDGASLHMQTRSALSLSLSFSLTYLLIHISSYTYIICINKSMHYN